MLEIIINKYKDMAHFKLVIKDNSVEYLLQDGRKWFGRKGFTKAYGLGETAIYSMVRDGRVIKRRFLDNYIYSANC